MKIEDLKPAQKATMDHFEGEIGTEPSDLRSVLSKKLAAGGTVAGALAGAKIGIGIGIATGGTAIAGTIPLAILGAIAGHQGAGRIGVRAADLDDVDI